MRSPEIVRSAERATMRPLWTTKRPSRPPEIAPGDHAASDASAASMIWPIAKGKSSEMADVTPRVATAAPRGAASGLASSSRRRNVTRSIAGDTSLCVPSLLPSLEGFDRFVRRRTSCHVVSFESTAAGARGGDSGGAVDTYRVQDTALRGSGASTRVTRRARQRLPTGIMRAISYRVLGSAKRFLRNSNTDHIRSKSKSLGMLCFTVSRVADRTAEKNRQTSLMPNGGSTCFLRALSNNNYPRNNGGGGTEAPEGGPRGYVPWGDWASEGVLLRLHPDASADTNNMKRLLDEGIVGAILSSTTLVEDLTYANVKLAIMVVSCVFACIAQFYPMPFPDSRLLLAVCVVVYFGLSGVLQYFTWFTDKVRMGDALGRPVQPHRALCACLQDSIFYSRAEVGRAVGAPHRAHAIRRFLFHAAAWAPGR